MKKVLVLLCISLLFFPTIVLAEESKDKATYTVGDNQKQTENNNTEQGELLGNAISGLLMEESTGEIIFEKEKDKRVPVASMTKMVAQIIILENIENGNLKWEDKVKVSKTAAEMGGSQIFLEAGEEMSIKDLFKGVSMASANDAVVQLAEVISGTEKEFVKLMNKKVQRLGLKNTNFVNCTGLDEENHYSSAYDMAIIAKELLAHEEILKFSSVYEDYLRQDQKDKFWLVNTNKLVRFYEGADGLKTGHTDNAKYCLAATAKRNGMRLIAIVLGEENGTVRNSEAMALLDYGFNTKKVNILKNKGDTIKQISISKGDKNKLDLVCKNDLGILEDKTVGKHKYSIDTKIKKITLPIKKGDVIGKVYVKDKNKKILEKDLLAKTSINKLTFGDVYLDSLKSIVLGRYK